MAEDGAGIGALQAKVEAAQAAFDKAEAAYEAEFARVQQINAEMEARGEEPFTSGPDLGPLHDAVTAARSDLWRAQADLEREVRAVEAVKAEQAAIDAANAADTLDTGHYDDSHAFGWKPSPPPPEIPAEGDTGHYDDSHAFGWKPSPPPPEIPAEGDTGHYDDAHAFGWGAKKKAIVAGGVVAAILAIAAAVVAVANAGGSSSTTKAGTSASQASSSRSASSSSTVSALPLDTVLAGCIAIDPQGNTTILHPGFLVANPRAGDYTATFAKGPTGTVHGTGTANGNLVVADVTITAFGTYDGLTLTGPGGAPVALGPIAAQVPLVINAQTDRPNGCDPHALVMPQTGPTTAGTDAQAAIASFLSQFGRASQTADVGFLVGALDPAVLARYSRDQCTADISAVGGDPTAAFTLKSVTSGPEPFTYTSDGQSTVVPDTYTVEVSRTANGATTDSTLHLSVDAGGGVHWFTDCTH